MTSESASQPQLVIWGTNINMHKVKIKFQEFIKIYLLHDEQEQKEFANEGEILFFLYIFIVNEVSGIVFVEYCLGFYDISFKNLYGNGMCLFR